MSGALQVVATAGHVDHGKSSLVAALTGMDPDRWEEEKRRGLTIDLGFAWTTLPSGREIGFVDVPGHERFVRNMLAGVGPVRLVLFVVAADEGWKPQSEEHLGIVDLLGAGAAVVALTKADLAEGGLVEARLREIGERLAGTALEGAPVVPCSAATGAGIEDLRSALDELARTAPPEPETDRPRLHVDRSFSVAGAGTVVTGTLAGGALSVGDEVAIFPSGRTVRIRGLQSHRRTMEEARSVSRVAASLAGTPRDAVSRGDVVARPQQWRPTSRLEVRLRPIRSLRDPLTARGAYKLYLGAAERDVRLHLYDRRELAPGTEGFARLKLDEPVIAAVGDPFVLRESGRRATVAGGEVLDADPPHRPGAAATRLEARRHLAPHDLAEVLVAERTAVRSTDLPPLTGSSPGAIRAAERVGAWWVRDEALEETRDALTRLLAERHAGNPLVPGFPMDEAAAELAGTLGTLRPALEAGLLPALLAHLEARRDVVREGTLLRLPGHQVGLGDREEEAQKLVAAVASGEPTPPDAAELGRLGFDRDLVDAACATGLLVRVSQELVVTPAFAARAEELARRGAATPSGLTVSRFRELLGTTRKYALPLLGWLDARGVTRREGDVRRAG
ncbi:MAG TPA: selenocysteine-specific translation elongation factor [Actinomycetota bacterium]|nr:selenocysteine-specific translation elongation factor [Actinomycetota bacterium]